MRKDHLINKPYHNFKKFIRLVLDLIYPRFCAGCGRKLTGTGDFGLCTACYADIRLNALPYCLRCGRKLDNLSQLRKNGCSGCAGQYFYFDQAMNACRYSGVLRHCLHLFKYKHRIRISRLLSDLLIRFLKQNYSAGCFDVITAVPLHRSRFLLRGFNQSRLLAENVSRELNIEKSFDSLMRVKKTVSQVRLSARQRADNTGNAFRCRHSAVFAGKNVLIIDDIFTTGSTLNACARALKQAGAKNVTCLTVAR